MLRESSRTLSETKGAIRPGNNIPIRHILGIIGKELLQLKDFLERGRSVINGHT
jgi:hypothetical protein